MGALLVFDEVLTGFGRTGFDFAMERTGARPDLVCLAKAMGGGLPLGGFAGPEALMATLSTDPPSTTSRRSGAPRLVRGGPRGPLDPATGGAFGPSGGDGGGVPCRADGARGAGALEEVRGIGLMIGLRFASAAATRRFVERAMERELLLGWTLHCDDVVRITPPLTLTSAHVAHAMARIADALGA